jgi:hypothetical protein
VIAARRTVFALTGLLAVSAVASAQSQSGFTYNGVVHVSWWWNEYNNFDQPTGAATDARAALAATNASWAGLLVTQYQDNIGSTVIGPRDQKTPTDASLRFAIQELHARNVRVMLKPHVDLWADSAHWRGQINPSDPAAWFQSYTQFIVHYAELAQEQGVEGFVVGTELVMMTGSAHQARWNAVIDAVRAVYGGLITYAANATFPADEFTSVSFWNRVDVMGLDGYFTLTNHGSPTLAELTAAWSSNANGENLVAAVQNLASAHGKPVIFTELGYKSVTGANTQPWNSGLGGAYDPTEQRNCYEAAFAVWSQRTAFMKGIFWWAWPVPVPGANDLDYNPRTKPAEGVLRTWQGGTATPNFTLQASPATLTVARGSSGTSTIAITRTAFTSAVTLSASGLPAGVTASFNPTSTSGNSSTLTLSASATAATGTSTVTVSGTGGGLTRTTTLSLTVTPAVQPNFTLQASPAALSIAAGASGTSTIAITRTSFTSAVALSAGGLPAGVTASFNPLSTTGTTSVLTLSASPTAAAGTANVTVTGTGGGLTRTTSVALTVTSGGGNGGLTVTPVVTTSSPWFNEAQVRLANTSTLTALTLTVVVQRTTGISASGQYNTVGGQIQQSNSSTTAAITYTFTLAPGQALTPATGRTFAVQTSGTGTPHPTSGDTWAVSWTTGGQTFSRSGTF